MLFTEISSKIGYGVVVDGWEMLLNDVKPQIYTFRKSDSIRDRFLYEILCVDRDVNMPTLERWTIHYWNPTRETPGGDRILLRGYVVHRNELSILSMMAMELCRNSEFWYGVTNRRQNSVRIVRVTRTSGSLDLEGAMRLILDCYGTFWNRIRKAVSSQPGEADYPSRSDGNPTNEASEDLKKELMECIGS